MLWIVVDHSLLRRSSASLSQKGAAISMSSSLKLKCELCRKGSVSAFLVQKKKQAPGRSIVKNPKSSLALNGRVPFPTLSGPRQSLATRSTCSASALVFAVIGWLEVWRSQVKPSSLASSSSSFNLLITAGSISWSKDLSVPSMLTDSEMTLNLSPEWNTGSVHTKNLPLLCFSSSKNCVNFWQNSTAFQIATFSFSGSLPCPPVPMILILMTVILLITAPYLHQMSPKLPTGQL